MSKAVTNTGRRAGLDRDDMVAAAIALVEAEGVDALTMRRLAGALGVTTNTVYWHVGNRDELILEIIRANAERVAAVPIDGATPRERVFSAARHLWDIAMQNRAVTSLAHQTGNAAAQVHPVEVTLARELEAAGLRGDDLARAQRAIQITVGGFLLSALRRDAAETAATRPRAQMLSTDDGLEPETVEALAAPPDYEAVLDDTLRTIIARHVP
ncbi:MAG: TetR family transcriptional regulator [Acidimicrobiales bacterium]|nr:TetR family transcriptional regulator [Acidimicrobiales bacterium]